MGKVGLLGSLSGRLIVAFVGVIVVAMLVLVAVVPEIARRHQVAALEDRLAAEARLIADYSATELARGPDADLDALAKRLGQRTQARITIIGLDGTVAGESAEDPKQLENHAGRPEVQQALATGEGVHLRYSATVHHDMLYVAVPIVRDGATVGVARTSLPLSELSRLAADLTRAILLAAVSGGLLAMLVALLAARAITRPLARLTRLAGALADNPLYTGHFRRGGGPAEVVQLDATLERMATAIRESLGRLEAERDRLNAVLANLADGIVMLDGSGRLVLLNSAAQRLLGTGKLAAPGRTVAEALRDHELVAFVDEARSSAAPGVTATRFLEWRNPRRLLRAVATRFGAGEAGQTLLVLQDLTELRRLETVRRDFVANVSHELRTPIASIKAMVETLEDGAVEDKEAARDFLRRIQQEVDGLHRLVEELLELSRLESGRVDFVLRPITPAHLIDVVVRRMAAMAERAGVSLAAEVPAGLPPALADGERLGQVLVNLVHNAIKFTPSGGAIVVRAATEGDRVRISVADTGVGIAPELLPRIFERFYKADQARAGGGTGLGLAIAKHTVELHSGKIWAESEGPGRGTTVHVLVPRAGAVSNGA